MTKKKYNMGELFCGAGGFALGAQLAAQKLDNVSLQHVWANDFDFDACETYRKNISIDSDKVIHKDVRNLDIDDLDPIDGFAFGFPCNDFSKAGKFKGLQGNYGPLYSYGIKVLASKQPKWFVAENVAGLTSVNSGEALSQILHDLQYPKEGLEYVLVPHIYSFDDYGVPQRRQRLVIVGIRSDLNTVFRIPSPEIYTDVDVTSRTALTIPPIQSDVTNNEPIKSKEKTIERLTYIRPGESAFSKRVEKVLPPHLHLHTNVRISSIYRKLDPDKPAYTVTANGSGSMYMYHWDENRALTNRERARLQTFPDNFVFNGNRASVRKQIGMAIPPQGAVAIFTALFKSFEGVSYPFIEVNDKLFERYQA